MAVGRLAFVLLFCIVFVDAITVGAPPPHTACRWFMVRKALTIEKEAATVWTLKLDTRLSFAWSFIANPRAVVAPGCTIHRVELLLQVTCLTIDAIFFIFMS